MSFHEFIKELFTVLPADSAMDADLRLQFREQPFQGIVSIGQAPERSFRSLSGAERPSTAPDRHSWSLSEAKNLQTKSGPMCPPAPCGPHPPANPCLKSGAYATESSILRPVMHLALPLVCKTVSHGSFDLPKMTGGCFTCWVT